MLVVLKRPAALAAVTTGIAVGMSAPAAAADAIVSVDFGAPTAELATTVTARVVADTSAGLYVKYRASGGPACAPRAADDPGSYAGEIFSFPVGDTTRTAVETFRTAGTYQWCAWLSNSSLSLPRATATGSFTVAGPQAAISEVTARAVAVPGRSFVVTVNGTTQVGRGLYWSLRPAGEPACAAAPALDTGSSGVASSDSILGSFSVPITMSASRPGRHRLCTWVAESSRSSSALTFNETPIVVPKPCTVPKLTGATLGIARTRLARAGCRVGRLTYVGRPHPRADRVVSAGRRQGAVLAPKAAVSLRLRR